MNHNSTPQIDLRSPWRVASGSLTLPISLACAVSLLLICLSIGRPVLAQGSVQDPALSPSIEQEYQAELEKWMLRAYEGDRDAQFRVGVLNTNSQFNPPDYEQAVYWYKQAARQGHVLAQYNLGHQYLTGVGVKPNQSTAMSWWLKAAKQDHALAQFNIGRAYYLGIGLKEDHGLARKWFERAAANNEPKSIDILQQLGWTDPDGARATAELVDASNLDSTEGTATELASTDQNQANDTAKASATSYDKASEIKDAKLAFEEQTKNEPSVSAGKGLRSVVKPIDPAPTVSAKAKQQENSSDASANQASGEPVSKGVVAREAKVSDQTTIAGALNTPRNPTLKTDHQPAIDSTAAATNQAEPTFPIALYTNPALRSVLIAIVDNTSQISVQRETGQWSVVRSNTTGFPVWVHGDFIMVDGDIGIITGTSVNARSVPIVTRGTVVGKLNKNELLNVVEDRDGWFRVLAPKRFQAWVKTSDLKRETLVNNKGRALEVEQSKPITKGITPQPRITKKPLGGPRPINDNHWLFRQPPNAYTLQLASFDEAEKIVEFESRAKFINNSELHRFTAKGKGIEWTYYLYGSYSSTETAQTAKIDIDQRLAWIRKFGQLQQNRCVAWKTQLPTPKELNDYCGGR
jgi:hypothetical protein